MSDLLGIIAPLKKFLSDTEQEITISFEGKRNTILSLSAGRVYNIPDFQREIRWTSDNVSILIEDIKGGAKFLGNIILTKYSGNEYYIIDGQQRITILTMILNCIRTLHYGAIEIIKPCKLVIESFSAFSDLMEDRFPEDMEYDKVVIESDKLKQVHKYYELWNYIIKLEEIQNKDEATKIVRNLGLSSVNIIIEESDDLSEGIRYFIDVNLKGKQLDTEDIFKSYLFRNDSSVDIRTQWYALKTNVANIEESKIEYSLLKLLEHYFLCDLYLTDKYKGMEFGADFLLKKSHKAFNNTRTYREGTHIIEVINDNQYMKSALNDVNHVIYIILEIVNSASITAGFKNLFMYIDANGNEKKLDDTESKIIHNIMRKILKDSKIAPKALIMKYILLTLIRNKNKGKEEIRHIYGIYMFTVLFTIFENKKSTEVLINVLKAKADNWYDEMIKQIKGYFIVDRITDSRLSAQYKLAQNEEEDDWRFRCKSLATIYNFLCINNGKVIVRKGMLTELYKFITDEKAYSVEHFIISQSKQHIMKSSTAFTEYIIDDKIYKKYVNNFLILFLLTRKLILRWKIFGCLKKLQE